VNRHPFPAARRLRGLLLALALCAGPAAAAQMTVYKTASCGCCAAWVDHVRAAGMDVRAHDVSRGELVAHKQRLGLQPDLTSCHTAVVDGYVIEGHVPAADIRRLLRERPPVVGLAVPGMPVGSPGMEVGDRVDPYAVLAFEADGDRRVFATHGQ
jgi:hypothetical protein